MTEKEFQLDDDFLASTQNFISAWCDENSIITKISTRIAVCCDEILSNIKFYSKASQLKITCVLCESNISIIFNDDGISFNPLTDSQEPDVTSPLELRSVGGLGIFMVKKMMDKVTYENTNNHNILTIKIQNKE